MNLILAFCVAMKHKLRFEPEYDYKDMKSLIENLDTFAKSAHDPNAPPAKSNATVKTWAAYLGIPGAEDNPMKAIKRSNKHHGHLPLEILNYLSSYLESVFQNETLKTSCMQTTATNALGVMAETLTGCERILMTPLPAAYNIAISQITWLYVLVLPFQLYSTLDWIAIPGTVVAAYIILGLAAIGREIENPFGRDVNDLDLDRYCNNLAMELDLLISKPPQKTEDFVFRDDNMVMWPLSLGGYNSWNDKGLDSK
jgi:predicted membrane chloride channel (bestrophin family)